MSDEKTTRHFIEELQRLKERLLEMGDLATSRIDRAVSGLTSRDPVILGDVIQGDESINALQIELDDRCFKLLALRQPMATDLRLIMSTTRITSDLERVGDLAVNVAEAAARYIQYPPVKPLIDLPKMSEFAQQMLRDALSSFVSGEVSLASDVLKRDDALDDLKRQVFQDLGDVRQSVRFAALSQPVDDGIVVMLVVEERRSHGSPVLLVPDHRVVAIPHTPFSRS